MRLLFLLIPLAFLSCKTSENTSVSNNNEKQETITSVDKDQPHNVEISLKTFKPYCGGAFPSDQQLNNYSKGVDSYLLINTISNDTTTVKSDSLGAIYLNLKNGNYEIRELYKNMSFNEFQEKNQPKVNQALLGLDENCYKKWWLENLLKFEVKEATSINKYDATIKKVCFTGKNPCLMYNGQLPK